MGSTRLLRRLNEVVAVGVGVRIQRDRRAGNAVSHQRRRRLEGRRLVANLPDEPPDPRPVETLVGVGPVRVVRQVVWLEANIDPVDCRGCDMRPTASNDARVFPCCIF